MENKLVHSVGVFTPKITLQRVLILFLLVTLCLTLVEAGEPGSVRSSFVHPPAKPYIYFNGSENILYLDRSGTVWISNDAGSGWRPVEGVPENIAADLIKHKFSEDKAYIFTTGTKHYKTSDKGKSWQSFTTPINPAIRVQFLSFNARREDYLLFRGTECNGRLDCNYKTYYTTDGFGELKPLLDNTDRCIWACSSENFDEAPTDAIFCIKYDVSGSSSMRKLSDYRLVESDDFFVNKNNIVDFNSGGDVRGVIGLGEYQSYLVAAVKDVNSLDMKLYVSVDGQKWARAFFPLNEGPKKDDKEEAYTILESSPSNHLIVDLLSSESRNTGTLFFSNSNGTYFIDRLNYTNRNPDGYVDFKLAQSVDGILLANIVSNHKKVDDGSAIRKELQSKISFDDGDSWEFIKPPEKNFDGSNFPCTNNGGKLDDGSCSLHLNLITSAHNYGHVLSANKAPGVLVSVGNVGGYLLPYDQCDTFLSYDGGKNWKVVKPGAHLYGIGHYGTILVLVDGEQPTNYISYSTDRGESWKELYFSNEKFRAKYLTTDPESTSKSFLLLCSGIPDGSDSGKYRYFTFKLDFSPLFDGDCNDNDFDDWSPERSNCFMGARTIYHRRKKDARCFVSKVPEPDVKTCPCTKDDFECDYNYIFDRNETSCIPLVPVPYPDECNDSPTYLGKSGYRMIINNICDRNSPDSVDLEKDERKDCSKAPKGPPKHYGEISHRTHDFNINNYFYFGSNSTKSVDTILMIMTTDGKVRRSKDGGTNWDIVLSKAGPIIYMQLHDHDKTRAYFFPKDRKVMYYTTDSGENFEDIKLLGEPNKLNLQLLDFHPIEHDWLLFMSSTECPGSGCHSITYFYNGKDWKQIETWADKCIFGKDTEFSETEKDVVFCSSYKDKNSKISQDRLRGKTSEANPLQLIKLKTDGEPGDILLSDVVGFYIFNEFMAVATEERGQLLLHTSKNGRDFSNATFPPNISVNKERFTILPSTTGSIFLDVYKSSSRSRFEFGSLFKSHSDGKAFGRILDNTNRNLFGNVDFEKVQGLDGIILANQVENVDEVNEYVKKKVITKISRDDGSRWRRLNYSSDNCGEDCYLNLHGRTDIYGPGGIFSAPSAIGLLIGVGNVGRYLLPYAECNTYMSRDGGKNWNEIRHGANLYEFGDQGTIIVLVKDKDPTDRISYSWDYGKNWGEYKFTSTPISASLLTTDSDSTSMKFLLLGHTAHNSPVMVTIDFSQLRKRQCDDDDFEEWDPMEENHNDHQCLLGVKKKYKRRKDDRECFIGTHEIEPVEVEKCTCTIHDFECAYGYWRNATGDCESIGPDPDRPANCKGTYRGHSGYKKMSKSKCILKKNYDEVIDKKCDSGNIIISSTKIFPHRIAEYIYFNKSNNILARTMDNDVYESENEGLTWKQLELPKIVAIIQNPYSSNYAYLITLGKTHYYTSDSGARFNEFEVPEVPNNFLIPILSFHPDNPDYLIYTGSVDCKDEWSSSCHAKAFYTLKNHKNWNDLESYVRTCQWGRDNKFRNHEKLILCDSYRDKEGSQISFFNNPLQLVSSTDFFKKDRRVLSENTVGTVIFEEFMVIAELSQSGQTLRLKISLDAKELAEAQFPPNMHITQDAYTVLESKTGSIILHATTSQNKKYGIILKSNYNGTYYSWSLGYANRDDNGFVDFEKMQGIPGIALANVVSNAYEVDMGNNKKLKSMITFNDGAKWHLLNRPDYDSNRHKYKCDGGPVEKCSLHLHSYTERRNPRDSLSSAAAIGLMMGVGNVGAYLTPYLEGDTFLTRDAGVTWTEVKKGAYMYEFGDQGAIIILADDEQPTDHILYSLTEGASWKEHKFTEQPIRVFDIDTMPGGLSSKFILRGYNPSNPYEEIVVYLDFKNVFKRDCRYEMLDDDDDDFEKWSPTHPDEKDASCLFGQKITYVRKIQENECFITDDPRIRATYGDSCECKEHDFECDYNYMRNIKGHCELVPGTQKLNHNETEQCANGGEFWYDDSNKGYRKLTMSKCEGGDEKEYVGERHKCPRHHSVLFWIIIVLLSLIIIGILIICFINKRHGQRGYIRLGSPIEPSLITDIFYQIRMPRMPRFISRLWSNIPLPGHRNRYYYSPVATDDGHEVLMDDYDQDNEAL